MKGEKNPRRGGAPVSRRKFLKSGTLGGAAALALRGGMPALAAPAVKPFELDEKTVAELQTGMKQGKFTAVSLAEKYLARIREIDKAEPAVNSVIEINPDALAIARALDRERKSKGPRGPLHGIPILIKDNIGTHDRMQTTAGSLALV
jgi:amidase